jgi:uncharacterized protein
MKNSKKSETNLFKSISSVLGFIAIGIAVVVATSIAASSWKEVKIRPKDRTIKVTGSARKRIVSNLIQWEATVETRNMDRTVAYQQLKINVGKALAFLKTKGIKKDSIRVSSVTVNKINKTEYEGTGDARIEKTIFIGFKTSQSIEIVSKDVKKIEKTSREITQLLESGVQISSYTPSYYYTKIGELKISMLAKASKDARNRAENIVSKADNTRLGRLRSARMGIININPANSTKTSWEGNNDTSSYEKDIITVVHVIYELD